VSLILDAPRPVLPFPAGPRTCPRPAGTPDPWAGLLARIADAVRPVPGGVLVDGDLLTTLPDAPAHRLPGELTEAVHQRWFLHHARVGRVAAPPAPREPTDPRFLRSLRELLGRRFWWDDGWRVVGHPAPGRWEVERDGLVLTVTDRELRPVVTGMQVRFPAERPCAVPGRFTVTGTRGPARQGPTASCYLDLAPADAPSLVTDLVSRLDVLGVPFSAAVLDDPAAFGRPDAVVVTTARGHLATVARTALGLHGGARASFGSAVPAFTRALAPGVAIADDPADGSGFGRHRCRAVAAGLLAAGQDAGVADRLSAVRTSLRRHGVDPAAPHLERGSIDLSLSSW
jgi:hypothetical protein